MVIVAATVAPVGEDSHPATVEEVEEVAVDLVVEDEAQATARMTVAAIGAAAEAVVMVETDARCPKAREGCQE